MSWIDICLLIAVAAALVLAVRKCVRDRKAGKTSCGGDCSRCAGCGNAGEK